MLILQAKVQEERMVDCLPVVSEAPPLGFWVVLALVMIWDRLVDKYDIYGIPSR